MYHTFKVAVFVVRREVFLLDRMKPLYPIWMYPWICQLSEGFGGCVNLKFCSIHKYYYLGSKGLIVPILGVHTIFICCDFFRNICKDFYPPWTPHILLLLVVFFSSTKAATPIHALLCLSALYGSDQTPLTSIYCYLCEKLNIFLLNSVTVSWPSLLSLCIFLNTLLYPSLLSSGTGIEARPRWR